MHGAIFTYTLNANFEFIVSKCCFPSAHQMMRLMPMTGWVKGMPRASCFRKIKTDLDVIFIR